MWFEGKFVKDISAKDIEALVDNQVAEDSSIEFKVEPYGGNNATDEKKCELCRDVSSFANASGGYIVIGIRDKDDKANGLSPIQTPEPHIERIRKTCMDGIEPRIPDLEVDSVNMGEKGHVIVIRIPDGTQKPYMVHHGHNTHFAYRYDDRKREMSYVEIRNSFRTDWTDQRLARIEAKIDRMIERTMPLTHATISAETNALTALDPAELERIMEARLRKVAEQ